MSPSEVIHSVWLVLRSLFVWLCFIPIAILNGGFRQHVLSVWLDGVWPIAVSGIMLSLFIILITRMLLPRVGRFRKCDCLVTGTVWMLLTVAFELSFGLASGATFSDMLAAYNPLTGNIWVLVVLATMFAPIIVYNIKFRNDNDTD